MKRRDFFNPENYADSTAFEALKYEPDPIPIGMAIRYFDDDVVDQWYD